MLEINSRFQAEPDLLGQDRLLDIHLYANFVR